MGYNLPDRKAFNIAERNKKILAYYNEQVSKGAIRIKTIDYLAKRYGLKRRQVYYIVAAKGKTRITNKQINIMKFPKIKPEEINLCYAYTITDVANLLQVARPTVYSRINQGLLKTKKDPDGHHRIPGRVLRDFLKRYYAIL